jgi:hypothetical protein
MSHTPCFAFQAIEPLHDLISNSRGSDAYTTVPYCSINIGLARVRIKNSECPRKVQLMAVAVPGDRQGLNLLVLEHCSSDATLLSGTSLSMVLQSLADDPLDHSIRSQLGTQTDVTLGGC